MSGLKAEKQDAIGLDLGTSRIVTCRTNGSAAEEYQTRRNAFVSLPVSGLTLKALDRENVPYATSGSEIIAYGDRSEEFANIVSGDTRRPMQSGVLNPDEPRSVQVMELLIQDLCGSSASGQIVCFSVPAANPSNPDGVAHHERTVKEILERLGFRTLALNEGLAVVYSELEADNYSGIGISFGGGMCNVCVAHMGLPVVQLATVRAGDYIDHNAASVTGETPSTVRLRKETEFSLDAPSGDPVDQALAGYYSDVINTAADALSKALGETKKMPNTDRAWNVVLSGGTSAVRGFDVAFERAIRDRRLPVKVGEIRRADDALHTTARGALMAALLEG